LVSLLEGRIVDEHRRPIEIRRILVAVDASPHSRAALVAAVEMAARFEAELSGLFVEDINVLRAAALPFARELGEFSARRRQMEVERIERRLRARSRRVRELLEALSSERSIRSTFRVVRGVVPSEVQAAAGDADMLVVGRAGWSYLRERQLGSTARAMCGDESPRITFLLHEGTSLAPPILVIYDGTEVGDQALSIAHALAKDGSEPLRVMLATSGDEDIGTLKAKVDERFPGADVMHRFWSLVPRSAQDIAAAVRAAGAGTLVLPASLPLPHTEALLGLVEAIDVPVLLVRC
jgi:nucleotide-binding universal stress UspA family protein